MLHCLVNLPSSNTFIGCTFTQILTVVLVLKSLEEVTRTDIGKKIKEGVEGAAKTAMHSAESVSKGGEKLGRTSAFRAISQVRRT